MRIIALIAVLGVVQPLAADDLRVLRSEARRTNPDFVVYVPGNLDSRAQPDKDQPVADPVEEISASMVEDVPARRLTGHRKRVADAV